MTPLPFHLQFILAFVQYFILSFMHWLLNGLSVAIRVYAKFITNWGVTGPQFCQNWWCNEKSGWNQYTREEKQGDQTSFCIQIGAGGGVLSLWFLFALPLCCCSCLSWNWSLLRIIKSCKSSELIPSFRKQYPISLNYGCNPIGDKHGLEGQTRVQRGGDFIDNSISYNKNENGFISLLWGYLVCSIKIGSSRSSSSEPDPSSHPFFCC